MNRDPVIAFAWYDEVQWHLLITVVPDRNELDDTFQEWEQSAIESVQRLEAQGLVVERIPVYVGALCSWCRERNLPVNGAARAQYVAGLLRHKGSGA